MTTQRADVVGRAFFDYLVDENGSPDLNVNGSVTPVEFVYTAPQTVKINRVNFVAYNDAREEVLGFFSLSVLTNGLWIVHRRRAAQGSGIIENFGTGLVPIRTHADFSALAGIDVEVTTVGGIESRFAVRWTLGNAGIPLAMQFGEQLVVTVRDDLSTLNSFRIQAQGQ